MNNQASDEQFIEHLTNLIRYEIDPKSTMKGAQHLQVVSHFLRTNAFKFKQYLPDIYLRAKVDRPQQYPQFYECLVNLTKHLQSIDKGKTYALPDILQQYYALKTAGITIGQTNALYLQKVIKSLAIDYETKQIRFWGKILGYRDYYVIQGVSSKKYLNQLSASSQPYGVGINTYSYWVSTNVLDDWVQLPLVTSEQVVASREFKYIFSGDLNKKISYPNFKGQERHLLKCVIARITHSCQLTPKGLYKLNQQNPTIVEFQEEFKCPQISQMNALDTWVHKNAHILAQGRASYYIDPSLNQQQKEALNTQLAQKDPLIQRFKGISEDKPYETLGFTANWSLQLQGQSIPVAGKAEGSSNLYAVVLLKNLVWPGAYTVGYKGAWCNIYIGYGHRISQQNVFLTNIKQLSSQGQDQNEKSEPNPAKAPQPEKKQEVNPDEPPPADD